MEAIVPTRSTISERFPVASFSIRLPQRRWFEIACATDPRLFHPDFRASRTRGNFYSTRGHGLLHADRGETTWLVPSDQLKRFAGAQRIYYALATYGSPRGEDAAFSISPATLDRVPHVALASDFTGRALDRSRLGAAPAEARWGHAGDPEALRWGGDERVDADRAAPPADVGYDDGFGQDLWDRPADEPADEPAAQSWTTPFDADEPLPEEEALGAADPDGYPDEDVGDAVAAPAGADWGWPQGDDEPELAPDETWGAPDPDAYEDAADARAEEAQELAHDLADDDDAGEGYEDAAAYYGSVGQPEAVTSLGDEPEELLPAGEVSEALGLSDDIPGMVALIRSIARITTGGEDYGRVHDATDGLVWGLLPFSQRSGSLGHVVRLLARRPDAARAFEGAPAPISALVATLDARDESARMRPVGGSPLTDAAWQDHFRRAGNTDVARASQNEAAIEGFVRPMLPVARSLGFTTTADLAVLIQAAAVHGVGGALSEVMRAIGVVKTQADQATALRALGCSDLSAFQVRAGLPVDGRWTARTHAAMVGALREHGAASPWPIAAGHELARRALTSLQSAPGGAFFRNLGAMYSVGWVA